MGCEVVSYVFVILSCLHNTRLFHHDSNPPNTTGIRFDSVELGHQYVQLGIACVEKGSQVSLEQLGGGYLLLEQFLPGRWHTVRVLDLPKPFSTWPATSGSTTLGSTLLVNSATGTSEVAWIGLIRCRSPAHSTSPSAVCLTRATYSSPPNSQCVR